MKTRQEVCEGRIRWQCITFPNGHVRERFLQAPAILSLPPHRMEQLTQIGEIAGQNLPDDRCLGDGRDDP